MKKLLYLFLSIPLFILISCNGQDENPNLMKVREIAWNGIDDGEFGKESVTINWRKANIEVEDDNYKVIFSTTHVTLGPIIVYVDIETMEIEGLAPRY